MTDWFDTLQMLTASTDVMLLCTATTGLRKSDQLLAVAYTKYDRDKQVEVNTLFRMVGTDALQSAAEYHRITKEVMLANAQSDDAIKQMLTEAMKGCTIFTYSVPFQRKALTEMNGGFIDVISPVCDLPLWLKAGQSRMPFAVELPIDTADKQMAKKFMNIPWKGCLNAYDIVADAPAGILPVTYNLMALSRLYQHLWQQPPEIVLAD